MQPNLVKETELGNCKKDPSFYFEDVCFLVGDTIFRLPRHHFEEGSTKFRDMFGLPGVPKVSRSSTENSVHENPLHRLSGIDIGDFRQFLRVLYPRRFDDETLKPAQWISVLKLAVTWEFEKVKALAIKALDNVPLDGIHRLLLARDYSVDQWLKPALRLVVAKKEFKEEWLERLGTPFSLKVVSLLGHVAGYTQQKGAKGGQKIEVTDGEIDMFIDNIFRRDLHTGTRDNNADTHSTTSTTTNTQPNGTTNGSNGVQKQGQGEKQGATPKTK